MRKAILASLLLGIFCVAGRAQSQAAPTSDSLLFTLKPLGHNVYAAIDKPRSSAGSNAGFVIGDDGVLVVDTFQDAKAAEQLLAEIRKLTNLPVKFVVNTHYHLDHVTGNGVFAKEGAVILAQKNVRAWIHTENLKFFGAGIKPEQKAWIDGLVAPSVGYTDAVEIYLGSRKILVRYFLGHTGGDSVVSIPDADVVFCGDLFWNHTLPNLIDASTEKWIASDHKLAEESPGGTFVPGHGEVGTAADVTALAGYITDLRAALAQPVKDGLQDDALANAVLPKLKEKYGDWNYFDHFAKRNILDTAKELRGEKKIPQSPAN
ncbi:MAG TPA: MBL fold metallo-hydrolase [Candidatus Acidoferrum sp.]|nr:MBL fold metallo-hydrolase [Candidatus Acidoferrum sp.]